MADGATLKMAQTRLAAAVHKLAAAGTLTYSLMSSKNWCVISAHGRQKKTFFLKPNPVAAMVFLGFGSLLKPVFRRPNLMGFGVFTSFKLLK